MKIYTKTGDDGTTGLYGGARISKDHIRIESYGTIDELNSQLGLLISVLPHDIDQHSLLSSIQSLLFTIGSNLASDPDKSLAVPVLNEQHIKTLEDAMDAMDSRLEPLRNFVLPGGSQANAVAHICRTVTRRAERRMITLSQVSKVDPQLIKYINRLSDYFFVLSRYVAVVLGHGETPWIAEKG